MPPHCPLCSTEHWPAEKCPVTLDDATKAAEKQHEAEIEEQAAAEEALFERTRKRKQQP